MMGVLNKWSIETAASRRRQDRAYLAILALLGIISVAMGTIVELDADVRKDTGYGSLLKAHLLAELGIAFIVGTIVAVVIEQRAQRQSDVDHDRRRQQIEQDIFRHLFGFGLPQPIATELIGTIFNSTFTRSDFRVNWQFDEAPSSPAQRDVGNVNVLTTVSYLLTNTSRGAEDYVIKHYFENVVPLSENVSGFVEVTCNAGGNHVCTKGEALRMITKRHGIRVGFELGKLTVAPEVPVRVAFTYKTLRRRSDCEVWITTLPTLGVTLEVDVSPSLAALVFQPDASHRSEPSADPSTMVAGSRLKRWEIKNGLLPFQGVVMYWRTEDQITAIPAVEESNIVVTT
jgi:hypothetical protein